MLDTEQSCKKLEKYIQTLNEVSDKNTERYKL